jgi:hypothetical protein
MAHGGAVDFVEGFGGGADGGIKAEGAIAAFEIVVDGFGDADAVDAVLDEIGGAGHGAIAADADDGIEVVGADVLNDAVGDVDEFGFALALDGIAFGIGLVAGAEDGSAEGEDVGDIAPDEGAHAILDEAQVAILDAIDFEVVLVHGGLGDRTDDRIEAGAVAAAGENADSLDGCHGRIVAGREGRGEIRNPKK